MKQFFVTLLAGLIFSSSLQAQDDYLIRPSEIGISLSFYDFTTAQRIRSSSLSSVLANHQWAKLGDMTPAMGINYFKGLKKLIDFGGTFSVANMDYPFRTKPQIGEKEFLLALDAQAYFKLISDKYWVQPFASAGLGGHKWGEYYGVYIPMGLGVNVNFNRDARLFIHTQYRVPVTTETANNHFLYSMGITGRVGKKKEPPPPPPAIVDTDGDGIMDPADKCPTIPGVQKYDGCPVPDSDKDGINDDNDKCPTVPGLAKYQGCPVPDSDKDGINDEEDKCPTQPGVARYQGCPVPDRDKDGINDEEDKCPDIFGVAKYQGCPVPDKDGDGVNDEEDKCPNVAGPAENFGCPVIGIKSYEVVFNTGSAVLQQRGKKVLDTVVAYLKKNPDVNITIDGHTDNIASDKVNDPLSVRRAESTKKYLVKNGIEAERLTTLGHGSKQPVADNKTAEGRRLNRRIEIKIKQ